MRDLVRVSYIDFAAYSDYNGSGLQVQGDLGTVAKLFEDKRNEIFRLGGRGSKGHFVSFLKNCPHLKTFQKDE